MNKIFPSALICFMSLSLNAQTSNCICCTENHQAFDFWIDNQGGGLHLKGNKKGN
ncbi:MAG: hypothetical protein L3J25_09870 [Flavobacteriaceae bacterium]|nr:hypothetical protein [Flavobacteriaceae bacterium]